MPSKTFRNARKTLELSQRGLGQLLGVSGQTVSNWESGEVPLWAEKVVYTILRLQDAMREEFRGSRTLPLLQSFGCSVRLEFDFEGDSAQEVKGNGGEVAREERPGLIWKESVYQQEKRLKLKQTVERFENGVKEKAFR